MKPIFFPVLLACACVLAGCYGAIHNQISYTVSSGYFHDFKFAQFAIAEGFQNRIGASIVGWSASWWMGVFLGIPIYITCLFVRGRWSFVRVFAQAALIVVVVTLVFGLGALVWGYWTINDENLPDWMYRFDPKDPTAFARAGNMHNFSYLGGLAGLLGGLGFVISRIVNQRRRI